MNDLFKLGFSKVLENEDLHQLNENYTSLQLCEKLKKYFIMRSFKAKSHVLLSYVQKLESRIGKRKTKPKATKSDKSSLEYFWFEMEWLGNHCVISGKKNICCTEHSTI